jgi:hypothetical protein
MRLPGRGALNWHETGVDCDDTPHIHFVRRFDSGHHASAGPGIAAGDLSESAPEAVPIQ